MILRAAWIGAGAVSLGLGIVGVVTPLLPTVPFLLLAAFCFARSSPRLHDWLLAHPRLGPPIQDWQRNGTIGRPAKYLATASTLATLALSAVLGLGLWVLALQLAAAAGVMAFIWTRPDA